MENETAKYLVSRLMKRVIQLEVSKKIVEDYGSFN